MRNKGALIVLAVIYIGTFFILNTTILKNDIHFVKDEVRHTLIIEVVKK